MILSNASCTTHCLAPVAKVFYLYGGGRDAAGILGRQPNSQAWPSGRTENNEQGAKEALRFGSARLIFVPG
jgi:hypothetical protein